MSVLDTDFTDKWVDILAQRIADSLFELVYMSVLRDYPWNEPITTPMEEVGKKVLELALVKFYERCS